MVQPELTQSVGYGIVVGLGLGFAALMIFVSWSLKKFNNENQTSEHFNTASHSVRTGLVASAVVSSWTWASTLLTSAQKTYQYGVSGAFWYASGACVQILLFTVLAIELKRKAPNAHTFLEVVRARCGPIAHGVFLVFAYITNILVMAMLLCGGSATISSVTGMNTVAVCFLLPVGVIIYTMFGGIKATFLTDYIHTVIILVILIMFSLATYSADKKIGSPGKLYDMLKEAGDAHPVAGNAQGSYLTMRSQEGAIFFIINLAGNFGTVFVDNGYWQKAIAANPASALPGYILGGLAWFAIPWLAATTMGLVALGLENKPYFPTYPNRMSDLEVSEGLVLPYAAIALMGRAGANATLLLVFMAVTSAASAELIAVSSIFTYDIYKQYVRPRATGKELLYTGHASLIVFGFAMSGFATGLYYGQVSMGYLYLLMGVLVCPAVVPATCVMLFSRVSTIAVTVSPVLGIISSIITWLVVARAEGGKTLTIETTGANNPMLAGNVVGLLSPALYILILSIIFPEKYDFNRLLATFAMHFSSEEDEIQQTKKLNRASVISKVAALIITAAFIILWPWPMYGTGYIFSKRFFTGWVVVGLIWIFFTVFAVGIFPLWEGRNDIYQVVSNMAASIFGRKVNDIVEDEGVVVETISIGSGSKEKVNFEKKDIESV
ncbi:Urea transporter [Schizosaccharomyces pombe]|uniref:Probable urea active transporter 1 n=1 Tax=Schizosaccharomyces pombe (strain 972 / ATCC 24843) TaxID=284812 RepID=DUR31_SCHPO|nr:putative urea transporter [Schizosaccharomyces pombe]O94469.1 RecName: Full=Probable urea active transporter 1 [Schizosaccharomyces pombe 972h-]CAA22629.1 urea transporter (predicted) [Schizosaccharomyces pombe]|eukprot:NP_595871.1 putative urea transporter [Schizosaccharomyces pombe]